MPEPEEPVIEICQGGGWQVGVYRGQRIRVSDIARLHGILKETRASADVKRAFPTLTRSEIEAALAYWRAHRDEIDREVAHEYALVEKIPDGR